MTGKRDDYPNFRRAQVERGPFYEGPPIQASKKLPNLAIMVALCVVIGALIGIAFV